MERCALHFSDGLYLRSLNDSHSLLGRLVLGALCVLMAAAANADERRFAPYVEGYVAGSGIAVGDVDFTPFYGGVTIGGYIHDGIGLELHADTEIASDRTGAFDLAYEGGFGVGLRFQSPEQRGLSGYLTLGYTQFSVRQERVGSAVNAVDLTEDFAGARLSIGLVQRLQRFPSLSVSAEYRHHNVDGGLNVDAFVLGLRVSTP